MLIYLLKFSACLAILLLFYKLVLEQVHIHHFKRYYLLSAFIISLGIPLITFTQYVTVTVEPMLYAQGPEHNYIYPEALPQAETNILPILLWSLYILGLVLFALKFFANLRSLHKSIKNNPKRKSGRIHHVLLQELIAPHTFFTYIFFNKKNYKEQRIPQEVFWHEETHARQKHSFDIIVLELLQIVFWFHPLVYWAKHLVKLNHEFLADQAVLKNGASIPNYQNLVLAFSSNAVAPPLANAIHYSSIKKRIVIMKTQTSQKAIWIKGLLLLPLTAILLYGFTSTKILENVAPSETIILSAQKDSLIGASERMMQEYRNFTDNLQKSEAKIITSEGYYRIEAIYNLMTDRQRASVTNYLDIIKYPLPNITSIKSTKPSMTAFESWKDNNKFAIWIDGQHVPNTVLNRYNLEDIHHFTSSFVYNNARSTKFPQPYQNHLYTKNGFEDTYSKHNIKEYKSLLNQYTEEIKSFHKKGASDTSELRILKVRLDQLYNSFSSEEMKKYNILPLSPLPLEQTNVLNSAKNQQGATTEEVAEYNKLAKKYNAQPINERVIKLKELERLELIYNRMTDTQKTTAQPFPECPPPPAPAPKPMQDPDQAEPPLAPKVLKGVQSNIPPPPPPAIPNSAKETGQAIPPPPPPYKVPNKDQHSKNLVDAFDKFKKKAHTYGKATDAFMNKGKGTLSNLQKLYEETMVLYDNYMELAVKEDLMKPTPTKAKEDSGLPSSKDSKEESSYKPPSVGSTLPAKDTKASGSPQKVLATEKSTKDPSVFYGNLYAVPQSPPQPNPDPVEYMKALAEKGATFYIGPHQYKAVEAIELVRKSKDPNIDVSNYPVVKLGGC